MRSTGLGAKTVLNRRVRLKAANCLIELCIGGSECQTVNTLVTLAQISWKSTPASKSSGKRRRPCRAAAPLILDATPAVANLSFPLDGARRNCAEEQVTGVPSPRSAPV